MAQAILLKDVDTLGEAGSIIEVSPGYLRNYLVPRKLAQSATKASVAEARHRLEIQQRTRREQEERAKGSAELLGKTILTIPSKAGEDGRLFGSVGAREIAAAIKEARGLSIEKRKILLEEPIKSIGTYMVDVEVGQETVSSVKTIVVEQK